LSPGWYSYRRYKPIHSFYDSETRDAEPGLGPAFDGSHGVDSEDIINIPQIGFGTFQLFPDQQQYGPDDPSLPAFNNTIQQGVDWITRHASLATSYVLIVQRLKIIRDLIS
jgi:hypothetical protein